MLLFGLFGKRKRTNSPFHFKKDFSFTTGPFKPIVIHILSSFTISSGKHIFCSTNTHKTSPIEKIAFTFQKKTFGK